LVLWTKEDWQPQWKQLSCQSTCTASAALPIVKLKKKSSGSAGDFSFPGSGKLSFLKETFTCKNKE